MNFHRYSFCMLISALIVYLLCKNVKRALSSGPLVREAPVWLMPGTARGHHELALREEQYYWQVSFLALSGGSGMSAFAPLLALERK
jgi:hypothetical protein